MSDPPSETDGTAVDTTNGGPSVVQSNEETENDLGNADRGSAKVNDTIVDSVLADKERAAKTNGVGGYFVIEAASAKASQLVKGMQ